MKLKMSRRQLTIAGVAAVAVLGVMVSRGGKSGDQPEGIDAHAHQACADFAAGYPKAGSKTERLALADKVTANSSRSQNDEIRKRAAEMGAAAGDSTAEWKTAAGALTAACQSG